MDHTKRLVTCFVVFIVMLITIISVLNDKLAEESRKIIHKSTQLETGKIHNSMGSVENKLKPVVIDAKNDPLAPVIKRVHERPAQGKVNNKYTPKPIYEPPTGETLFIQ